MSGSFDDDAAGARAVYLHERKLAREGGPIMNGHTAGKWKVGKHDGHGKDCVVSQDDKGRSVWIADAWPNNLPLIAASPLLLEALKEAREFIGRHDFSGLESHIIARIDSAIAAAIRSET